MSVPLSLAIALTRSWTATYTRGLPASLRNARRAEIDCDLWEQQRAAALEGESSLATASHALARFLLGIPADISWRAEMGLSARQERTAEVRNSSTSQVLLLVGVVVAVIPVLLGLAVIGGLGADGPYGRLVFGSLVLLTGVVMLAGLLLSDRMPLRGLVILAFGVVAISVMLFWMAFITLPVGVVLLAIAYSRARRTGWRWPRGAGLA